MPSQLLRHARVPRSLPALCLLTALLWPATGTAQSSCFRLIRAQIEKDELVVEVALSKSWGKVDFFAHATQPRHSCEKTYQGPLIREGFPLGTLGEDAKTTAKTDFAHTFRVPLAAVQAAQPIAPGKELYIAANWPCSTNSGAGHQWGGQLQRETARITGTHCVLEATKNGALRCRGNASPRWRSGWTAPQVVPRPAVRSPWQGSGRFPRR